MTRIVGRLGGSVLSALDHTAARGAALGGRCTVLVFSLSQLLLRIKQTNKEDLGGDGRKTAANPAELASRKAGNKCSVLLCS